MFRFPLAGRPLFCLELSGLSLEKEINAGSLRVYVVMEPRHPGFYRGAEQGPTRAYYLKSSQTDFPPKLFSL